MALYGVNQVWLKPLAPAGYLHSHLNDVLAGTALAAFSALLIRQRFRPSPPAIAALILLIVSSAGVYWEAIAPLYRAGSTGDLLDLVAYFAGACVYMAIDAAAARSGVHPTPPERQ